MKKVKTALFTIGLGALSACSGNLVTGGPLVYPGQPISRLEVINYTGQTIVSVGISACDVGSYGLSRLPDGVELRNGQSYSWTVSAGCWDVLTGNSYIESRERIHISPGALFRLTVN